MPVYTEEEYKKIAAGRSDGSKSVENTLNGTPIIMESILRMEKPVHYRNKAQFPVGYDKDGNLVAGFYAGRTHSIIPQTDCLIPVSYTHLNSFLVRGFMVRMQNIVEVTM